MERFTAEALNRERDDAIKRAIKAKMPYPDIMAEFGLGIADLDAIIKKHGLDGGPPRRDDLRDSRDEPKRR